MLATGSIAVRGHMTRTLAMHVCCVALHGFLLVAACDPPRSSRTTNNSDDAAADGKPIGLRSFAVSECKSDQSTNTLVTGRQSSDYAGLGCVAWDFTDDSQPRLDLINREVGCGFQGSESVGATKLWRPSSLSLKGSRLQLALQWNFESPSACGGCLDDFSMSLEPFDLANAVSLEIRTRDCTGNCKWSEDTVEINVVRDPAGIACRYLDRYGTFDEPATGKLHRPVNAVGGCDDDLDVLPRAPGRSICVARCSDDSDCPLQALLACEHGTCQIASPWK
jgi:hypothetical protein